MRRCRGFPDFEIFQYAFSHKILCALPVLLLRPLMTITHAISGLRQETGRQPIPDGRKKTETIISFCHFFVNDRLGAAHAVKG